MRVWVRRRRGVVGLLLMGVWPVKVFFCCVVLVLVRGTWCVGRSAGRRLPLLLPSLPLAAVKGRRDSREGEEHGKEHRPIGNLGVGVASTTHI